jgi:hypothetical protein
LHHNYRAVAHLDLSHAGRGRKDGVAHAYRRTPAGGSLATGGQDDPYVPRDKLKYSRSAGDGLPGAHRHQHEENREPTRQDPEIARSAPFFCHLPVRNSIVVNLLAIHARNVP